MSQITGVYLESIVCQETHFDVDSGYPRDINQQRPALIFRTGELEKFINELQKVRSVCNSVDMGDVLYRPWLESRLAALDKKATTENNPTYFEFAELVDDNGELPFY